MPLANTIRKKIRREPQNSGIYHPTIAYLMLAHGNEELPNKKNRPVHRIVPKGCILVVKSHSGDTVRAESFFSNVIATLQQKNRDILLDPVTHKVELYDLFQEKQLNHNMMWEKQNHSIAIYREGDSYPEFVYSPVVAFPNNTLLQSGIIQFKSDTPEDTELITDYQTKQNEHYDRDTPAFLLQNGKYVYNTALLDIPSYFKHSNINRYYHTKYQVKDIIDCIAECVAGNDSVSNTSKFKTADFNDNLLSIIHATALLKIISDPKNATEYESLLDNKAKADYRTAIMKTFTVTNVLEILSTALRITQSRLFELVDYGALDPGVFYHLACRATDETDPYTRLLRHSASEVSQGIKNRISEAELQRKNQIRQVMNTRKNITKNNFTRSMKEVYNRKIQNSLISKYKNLQVNKAIISWMPDPEMIYMNLMESIVKTTNILKKDTLLQELHSLEEKHPTLRLKTLAKLLDEKQRAENMIRYNKSNNKNSPWRKQIVKIDPIIKEFYSDIQTESKPIPF